MFEKVLIANRGAIAVRIIRTLKKLGIQSVAVYAESDADSLHVRLADEAHCLGEGGAAQTYLDRQKILRIAKETGTQAIHPGYGFLSENASFVQECEAAGIVFIGPTAEQMLTFGLKHKARELAEAAKVPLCPGSELLKDLREAQTEAERIGYPVMLKSTAGGGGIGMQLCYSQADLNAAFDSVKRMGANNFADDGVFLEKFIAKARHIEVQVFGDGRGKAVALGERDCSSQRRNQKVVEECPAPNLSNELRSAMQATAEQLLASVCYRNAGTVEFIYDAIEQKFYFLEVNTRLQVEHGVTEEVWGVDLVEWMLHQAANELGDIQALRKQLKPNGHAIQVRIYAEDPAQDFRPCAGLLSQVKWPTAHQLRIDHWVESGIEVPAFFDPMLAKVIAHGANRTAALEQLRSALAESTLYGIETNLQYLRKLLQDPVLVNGEMTTRYLNDFTYRPARIDVVQGGTMTTIQDVPGRSGYWHIGVPTSGPFDSYSFQLGNRLLNNNEAAAGLEITLLGPTLKFGRDTLIALTGAEIEATLDDTAVPLWRPIIAKAGQQLHLGRINGQGARAYLCVAGGIQCPDYLGAKSTFTLGQFGGHNGRALRAGDVLALDETACNPLAPVVVLPAELKPAINNEWQLRVIYGPHGAPDFFTDEDITSFFAHAWEVHYNSSRTGVRLIGPKPQWARSSGGEAGMHPSNIHDNAYAFGTVDFTGDMPVILGPDGPSLGGFVCPATVITADLWKLGQVRAGDKIRFVPVTVADAVRIEAEQSIALQTLEAPPAQDLPTATLASPIVAHLSAADYGEDIVYRVAGDHFLLVEYGPLELDIRLRFRAHALMQWLEKNPLPGLRELTPGIRSLQVHYDSQQLPLAQLIEHLQHGEQQLSQQLAELSVPSRIVRIPLSWDDEACHLAIEKYMQSVRANAPWCPSNLEFIRRINGLDSIQQVKDIVFKASYLVMGLGDVYLGAPVATPIDPRHRLVTTKYNPARTWTAENSVGIGGSYMCIYGMEGPGGYQFIGRTLQMWNRYRTTREFTQPWLLRFFDQIRFYEVSNEELSQIRRDFPQGRYPIAIEETQFSLSDYQAFLESQSSDIANFTQMREQAFDKELARWHRDGQFNYQQEEATEETYTDDFPEDAIRVDSSVSGSVWQAVVAEGQQVAAGEVLMILESMKMEINISAPCAGKVLNVLKGEGARVQAGQTLVVLTGE